MITTKSEDKYSTCDNCKGLFVEETYFKHIKFCKYEEGEEYEDVDQVDSNVENFINLKEGVTGTDNIKIDVLDRDINMKNSVTHKACFSCDKKFKVHDYEKHYYKCSEEASKKWLMNSEIQCSICKKSYKVNKIEDHEIQCRKQYLEIDNSKFVSILLNFTDYPEDWSKGMTENLRVDILSNEEINFHKLELRFKTQVPQGIIHKIERIQNKRLWDKYTREKNRILAEKGSVKEHFLFHGCKTCVPDYIMKTGFDISFASDGGMFGRGLYFARLASYSCPAYCSFDKEKNVYHVFVAKVITGTYKHLPNGSGLKKPPFWDESKLIYYDSVTNQDNKDDHDNVNQMYVIYDNDKAYPYYMITYSLEVVKPK